MAFCRIRSQRNDFGRSMRPFAHSGSPTVNNPACALEGLLPNSLVAPSLSASDTRAPYHGLVDGWDVLGVASLSV